MLLGIICGITILFSLTIVAGLGQLTVKSALILIGGLICCAFLIAEAIYRDKDTKAKNLKMTVEIRDKLSKLGLPNLDIKSFRAVEDSVRNKIKESLAQHGIDMESMCDSNTEWGYCSFAGNTLFFGIKVGDRPPENSNQASDAYQYFCVSTIKADNVALTSAMNADTSNELIEIKDYAKLMAHIDYVSLCANQTIKVTCRKKIKLDNLVYYKIEGDTQYVSDVSGGGANIGGAIAGGIIAGSVGAIVGSQVGTNVTTDIKKQDDRKILLYLNQNGRFVSEEIITNNIDNILLLLRKWIPQKEYHNVAVEITKPTISNNVHKITESATNGNSYAELKELKALLDEGIISQEEFEAKKKQILGL